MASNVTPISWPILLKLYSPVNRRFISGRNAYGAVSSGSSMPNCLQSLGRPLGLNLATLQRFSKEGVFDASLHLSNSCLTASAFDSLLCSFGILLEGF